MATPSIASRLILKHPCFLHLESCQSLAGLKQIHAQILKWDLLQHPPAIDKFIARVVLSHPHNMGYARLIFYHIERPSLFFWNTMIRGFSKARRPKEAVRLYAEMVRMDLSPNPQTLSFVANACGDLGDLRSMMVIHLQVLKTGCHWHWFVSNSLVRGYVNCCEVDVARQLFDKMAERDTVTWTVMISGYVRSSRAREAIELFAVMRGKSLAPDEVTMVALFNACSQLGDLRLGMQIKNLVYRNFGLSNTYIMNSLIDMYVKCSHISEARRLFDEMLIRNVVSWNTIVAGYAKNGGMLTARLLFDQMPERNAVSWSAMISGYTQNADYREALVVYKEMQNQGCEPNAATLVSVISACAHLGHLKLGEEIHLSLDDEQLQYDVCLSTALVDMYSRCGLLETARFLFNQIRDKNLISWNVMIFGYAMHGKVSNCIECFNDLQKTELQPDSITFAGLLSGCVHAGWLEEGKKYFDVMNRIYGICPRREHYALMVDLFGRAGRLVEALEFIDELSVEPDVVVWGALLNACKIHKDIQVGEFAAVRLLELDPKHGAAHILLSNIYADANKWEEVLETRKRMKERKIENRQGCSLIELNGIINEFVTGDYSHPETNEILLILNVLHSQLQSSRLSSLIWGLT